MPKNLALQKMFKVKVKKKTQHPNLLTLISINLNPKEKFTKYI